MAYIEEIGNKLTCNHPKVSNINEWGGVGLDQISKAFRFINITMSNGDKETFQDFGEGKAIEDAEHFLKKVIIGD